METKRNKYVVIYSVVDSITGDIITENQEIELVKPESAKTYEVIHAIEQLELKSREFYIIVHNSRMI